MILNWCLILFVVVCLKNIDTKYNFSPDPSLRFGLELCDDEEKFLSERKLRIFKGLNNLLKDLPTHGPQNPDQVRVTF